MTKTGKHFLISLGFVNVLHAIIECVLHGFIRNVIIVTQESRLLFVFKIIIATSLF